jgi:hypothetical protein
MEKKFRAGYGRFVNSRVTAASHRQKERAHMGKRYGIAVKRDDGLEEISNIMEKEGGPPFPGSDNARVIEDLDPRVKIGMVSGGKGESAAGFGYNTLEATPPAADLQLTDEQLAEQKKERGRAALEEAKRFDNFGQRQSEAEAEAASSKKAATVKAADDKAAAKKS